MLIKPDCIPCILNMAIISMRMLPLEESRIKELYSKILKIPGLRGQRWDISSPEVIELVMQLIVNAINNPDPFRNLKAEQNRNIQGIQPFLKEILDEASDPLHAAVKLAILGNTIDLMMGDRPTDIENSIIEKLKPSIPKKAYFDFRENLKKCRSLVYIGDNAGEIVFDKLLIEVIQKIYDLDVVFIVRSIPTLNDATLNEARSVGMDETATIVENGIDGPCPGTILSRCSGEVNELISNADLIISKGGGNFDTLDEEKKASLKKPVSFMLLSKCQPYYESLHVEVGLPILANAF